MSATKQKSAAGRNVAVFFIVFIILELLVLFGVSRVFKNKDVTPSLAGYSMYIMDSDAMGKEVPKGSLVIAANGAPSVEGIGKAILAEEVPGIGTSVFWLRDVSTSADLNSVVYTVYQEKNSTKFYQLTRTKIVGIASSYYVTAGKIITFMTSQFGRIALIAAPLFLFVFLELIIMIVNHARNSDDDDEDEDDYDDEDEEPVKLDDFLFGGENDEKLIEDSIRHGEAAIAEDSDISFESNEEPEEPAPAPAAPIKEPEPEPVVRTVKHEETPAPDAKTKPDIDPSYYEKAAKLIDGEAAPAKAEETAPKVKVEAEKAVKKAAPDIKLSKENQKNISASLEDLMKLMEAESNKLKDQINKK